MYISYRWLWVTNYRFPKPSQPNQFAFIRARCKYVSGFESRTDFGFGNAILDLTLFWLLREWDIVYVECICRRWNDARMKLYLPNSDTSCHLGPRQESKHSKPDASKKHPCPSGPCAGDCTAPWFTLLFARDMALPEVVRPGSLLHIFG